MADELINQLKSRERNGYFDLTSKDRFAKGDKVRTDAGPLAGMVLIYDGMTAKERCAVLAQLLGRYVRVELKEKTLLPVTA